MKNREIRGISFNGKVMEKKKTMKHYPTIVIATFENYELKDKPQQQGHFISFQC